MTRIESDDSAAFGLRPEVKIGDDVCLAGEVISCGVDSYIVKLADGQIVEFPAVLVGKFEYNVQV